MSSYADEADDEGKQESELSESLQCIGVPSQVLVRVGLLGCRSCNEIFLSMYNVVQILQRRGCLASTQVPWHLHIPKLPRYEQFHHPLPLLASSHWIKCIFSTVGANSTLTVVSCNCKPSLTEQGSVGRCQLLKESLAWSASTHPHRASQYFSILEYSNR